jgi:hypothetical protein
LPYTTLFRSPSDQEVPPPVSRLSVHYLIAGLPFAIRNTGSEPLRYVTGSSLPGRYPEPPLFDRLRRAAADPTHVQLEAAA